MNDKVMKVFSKMLSDIIEEEPKDSMKERPLDATEDLVSNCCTAPFGYPGWPDNDICSKCFEHAGIDEDG